MPTTMTLWRVAGDMTRPRQVQCDEGPDGLKYFATEAEAWHALIVLRNGALESSRDALRAARRAAAQQEKVHSQFLKEWTRFVTSG